MTLLKAQALNLAPQSPSFKLGTLLKAQALNSAPYPKPSFKPGIDDIHFPYLQTRAFSSFQNFKISNQPIVLLNTKELRNPDSLSLIEIHMSEVKSLSGPLKKKVFFVCYYLHFISFFGKNKYSRKSHSFAHFIKGTAVGRALWGASTFPTRNRLPDSKSGFANLFYLVFGFL